MSRNLCGTECPRCGSTPTLIEEPRPITKEEAGIYFDEYDGLIVANADCPECAAKYIAWVDERQTIFFRGLMARTPEEGMTFFDLSYRSTFNDEPGEGDLPVWYPPLYVRVEQCDVGVLEDALERVPMIEREVVLRIRQAINEAINKVKDAQ